MSMWETEADFYADLVNITCFKPVGLSEHTEKKEMVKKLLWYESESDDETTEPIDTSDHLQMCNEVQREVRNTLGHCYSNEHIEKYYRNMPQSKIEEPPVRTRVTTGGRPKSNVANDIINAVHQLTIKKNGVTGLNGVNNKSEDIMHKSKKTKPKMNGAQSEVMLASSVKGAVDIRSEHEFPTLRK